MLPEHVCRNIYNRLAPCDQLTFSTILGWDLHRHMLAFFHEHGLDWNAWKTMLRETGAEIKGSFALLFHSPNYFRPNDIDIYFNVSYKPFEVWHVFLTQSGYIKSQTVWGLQEQYIGNLITHTYFLQKNTDNATKISSIQLIEVDRLPKIDNTANECTINADQAICIHPALTKKAKIIWRKPSCIVRQQKYQERGFQELTSWEKFVYRIWTKKDTPEILNIT
jgi:hypothetical protein